MTDGLGSAPGDVVDGRYRLDAVVGRGGMAVVWRATDLRLDRPVAIKIFRAELAEAIDPQRTARETHLLAGVHHPSVVGALDASSPDSPLTYLVLELVEGADLKTLLTRGAVEVDLTRRVLAEIADALALLHGRGVVHRDVKPANILVVDEQERQRTGITAKLTDFGIAQALDGTRITSSDMILGTAAYLSPEQVRGGAVGPGTDIYSTGLVLAECLSGRRAFPGPPAESALARLSAAPPLPPEASPELAALLSAMTAMDPADRPAASAVAATLRDLAGSMTVPDAAPTAPVQLSARSLFAGAAAGAGAGAAIAAVAGEVDEADEDPAVALGIEPDGGGGPAPRRHPLRASALAAVVVGVLGGTGAVLSAPLLFGSTPSVQHVAAPSGAVLAPGDAVSAGTPAAAPTTPPPSPRTSAPPRLTRSSTVASGGSVASAPVAAPPSRSAAQPSRSAAQPSRTASPAPSPTPTGTPSPTPTPSSTATATPSPSPDPAPSGTASAGPTPSATPSTAPSATLTGAATAG